MTKNSNRQVLPELFYLLIVHETLLSCTGPGLSTHKMSFILLFSYYDTTLEKTSLIYSC